MVGVQCEDFGANQGETEYEFNFPLKMVKRSDFKSLLLKVDNRNRKKADQFEENIGMSDALVKHLYSFLVGSQESENPEALTVSLPDGCISELCICSTHISNTFFVFKKTYGEGYGASREFWLFKNTPVDEIKLQMGCVDEKIFGCAVIRIETEFHNPFDKTERIVYFIPRNALEYIAGGKEYFQSLHIAEDTWNSYNAMCPLCGGPSFHPGTCKKCDDKMPTVEEALEYERLNKIKRDWWDKFVRALKSGDRGFEGLKIVGAEIILDQYQREIWERKLQQDKDSGNMNLDL